MRKSHFNGEFSVLLGPITSRFFACSNEEKNKTKQQRERALVLSQWFKPQHCHRGRVKMEKSYSVMSYKTFLRNLYTTKLFKLLDFQGLKYTALGNKLECLYL